MNRKLSLMQKLLIYTKEELAIYILRYCFSDKNIEESMQDIHCQFLLDKDKKLTNKEHEEEMELIHRLQKMPNTTFEEQVKRANMYEKLKKLIKIQPLMKKDREKLINLWRVKND